MINLRKISNLLETNQPLTSKHEQTSEYTDWENLRTLHDHGLISTQYVTRNKLVIYIDIDTEIARIEWCTSPTDGVAYIHWTKVKQKYQQNGIGSTIRKAVLDTLRKQPTLNWVFSEAYSKKGRKLMTASSQKFKPLSEYSIFDHLETDQHWFAKTI